MHEPQEKVLQSANEEQQGIDLEAAYKVLVRAFYRLESTENSLKETDHE